MSPFGGYDMPTVYTSIIEEHNAVRRGAGVFDVSHMGEVLARGADAEKFVNHIFTNDVREIAAGQILYGMMLYPDGGTADDLLVYKKSPEEYLLVVNAANIKKDYDWITENSEGFDVALENRSDLLGQVAVQGPESEKIMEKHLHMKVSDLRFYTFKELDCKGRPVLVSRTGYTGEDGFEIYAAPEIIREIWDILIESKEVMPCGLGCRDTLRFEAGLPLYGHELSRNITPIEAGLGMFVKLDKPEFIGREAMLRQKEQGTMRKIVGIELRDKAVPRSGYDVEKEGGKIGYVTTGYRSISAGKSVCMALVDSRHAALGTEVDIRIRKKIFKGIVCKKCFYRKNYKK